MPYIYSTAANVWKEDYTMLRLLAFDFAKDKKVWNIDDQFMFGQSMMICPVTEPMYYEKGSKQIENSLKTKKVYLPKGTGWYDFWSNQYYEGGQTIEADAMIDKIPIFIKAGSILPMTQVMQYVDEIPDAPIEVRIYPGADAEFEIYEDEGNSYRYENEEYAITKLSWSDSMNTLTIGEKVGSYPGMIKDRIYNEVIVNQK